MFLSNLEAAFFSSKYLIKSKSSSALCFSIFEVEAKGGGEEEEEEAEGEEDEEEETEGPFDRRLHSGSAPSEITIEPQSSRCDPIRQLRDGDSGA